MQNVKRVMWLKLIMDTPWGRQTPSFTICGSVLAVSYKMVFFVQIEVIAPCTPIEAHTLPT